MMKEMDGPSPNKTTILSIKLILKKSLMFSVKYTKGTQQMKNKIHS